MSGACRDGGRSWAKSGYGVHFAKESRYNCAKILGENRHTRERAELWACISALDVVLFDLYDKMRQPGNSGSERGLEHGLVQVVIKSDSEYLVQGVTEWLPKWLENDYITARGNPAMNADLFKRIAHLLYHAFNVGVEPFFWQVPKSRNRQADELANSVLEKSVP